MPNDDVTYDVTSARENNKSSTSWTSKCNYVPVLFTCSFLPIFIQIVNTIPCIFVFVFCSTGQCDNYNLKSHGRCSNMSRMDVSGHVGHVTICNRMFSIACCLV